jgi:hypothetical protein
MTGAVRTFFQLERTRAGWRFWLLWVAATNLGFFPGLELGEWVAARWQPGVDTLLASALRDGLTALIYIALVSALQAAVLVRHTKAWRGWFVLGVPSFALGIFVGALLLDGLLPGLGFWPRALLLGGIAGAVAGPPLWWALRRHLPIGGWWVAVNALAWLIFFPGMVTGIALALTLPSGSDSAPPS